MQLPLYRSSQRDMRAPQGFSPGSSQPPGRSEQLTQENNGGPRGFGQPRAPMRMSAAPRSSPDTANRPTPSGPAGHTPLYPPSPMQTTEQLLWANRYSQNPFELLAQAGQRILGQPLTANDVQQIVGAIDNVDEAMLNFGQWLQRQTGQPSTLAVALSPVQSAILSPRG